MSYDIWLVADLGGPEPVTIDADGGGWNYTSNVSCMWRKAMPETDGLYGMDGLPADRALVTLRAGILRMKAAPDDYRAMGPDNGWGSFEGQMVALERLACLFLKAPKALVRVSA